MTITADSHYRGVNRLSRERFRQIAFERFAQPVLDERDPGEYWDAIIARDCDPLFILHVFAHESTYGKYGTAQTTKSWGNTRAPSFGAEPVGDVGGRSGTFPIFKDWLDGCISTVARLMTPNWYYTFEQRSIGEVFRDPHYPTPVPGRPIKAPNPRAQDRPVEWAPAGDLNNPDGYLRAVLDGMNRDADIAEEEVPVTDDPQAGWLPSSNYTAGRANTPIDRIIIHTTEGSYAGSLNWLRGAAGSTSNRESSSHYLLDGDGKRLVQLVREVDTAHTAGNWGYNLRSINVEMEGYARVGGFSGALYTAVGSLVGRIATRHGIPLDREHVIAHADVPSPNNHADPGPHFDFGRLLRIASGEPVSDPCRAFPETGFRVCFGFRAYWEQFGGLAIFGYPISDEFTEDGVTMQWFERARFEHRPGLGLPFDVALGRVGAEAMAAG